MTDDNLSAKELRDRYAKGGSLADSELTASQLRARHGISHNDKNFSTKNNSSDGGTGAITIALGIGILLIIIIGYYVFGRAFGKAGQHEEL